MTDPQVTTPVTIAAGWQDSYGYVRLVVDNVPSGAYMTIKRVSEDGSNLETIDRLASNRWLGTIPVGATGTAFAEDYRAPLGRTVRYQWVTPTQTTPSPPATAIESDVDTPADEAWLRDVAHPILASSVRVVDTGGEQEQVIEHIYAVSGRRLPLVVHDVRQGRQGTVQLAVQGIDERNAVEALLATGNPLLLAMCADVGWRACYMAVGNAVFTRWNNLDRWLLDLDYIEVDNVGYLHIAPDERLHDPTYGELLRAMRVQPGDPPPEPGDPDTATYRWVYASDQANPNFSTYLDLVVDRRNPQ